MTKVAIGLHIAAGTLKWLRRYAMARHRKVRPTHLFFCVVDHYEPGTRGVDAATEIAKVNLLVRSFPAFTDAHKDNEGRRARRTWFFPPHYHRYGTLRKLVRLCERGYGEIELHLHHGKHCQDTAENLAATLRQCVEEYGRFGIFGTTRGLRRYGFIHGDYALDNSRDGLYCGVNNEIEILERTGCYADFTHPSLVETTPSLINSIYYARGRDGASKSYDTGEPVRVGRRGRGLMIVQGPAYPFFLSRSPTSLRFSNDVMGEGPYTTAARINMWLRSRVGVQGNDDVVFVKVQTHGALGARGAWGDEIEFILTYLETHCNDSDPYVLHYVTARELYNVVRFLEDGHGVDGHLISEATEYEIEAPRYNAGGGIDEASPELKDLVARTYRG